MLKVGDVVFVGERIATIADISPDAVTLVTVKPLPSGVGANLECWSPDGGKRVYVLGEFWGAKPEECQPVTQPGELPLEIRRQESQPEGEGENKTGLVATLLFLLGLVPLLIGCGSTPPKFTYPLVTSQPVDVPVIVTNTAGLTVTNIVKVEVLQPGPAVTALPAVGGTVGTVIAGRPGGALGEHTGELLVAIIAAALAFWNRQKIQKHIDQTSGAAKAVLFAALLACGAFSVDAQVLDRQCYTNQLGEVQKYYLLEPERVYIVTIRIRDNEWWQPGGFDMRGEPFASAWVLEPQWDFPAEDMIVQDVTVGVARHEEYYGPVTIYPP